MFLNPFMLFGLAAVSVPIVIHLLNKRKFDRVQWAAMRFLQVSVEQNQRRLQLEDILLLILRCAMLALLAFALARPALKSASAGGLFGGAGVNAVVILDNSYSMAAGDGVITRFDQAKKAAEQVIELLPSGSNVAIVLASDVADAIIPEPTYDLNLARGVIREAKLTARGTDLYPSLRNAVDTLQRRSAVRREIYLVTDGQSAGFRQFENIRKTIDDTQTEIKTTLLFTRNKLDHNAGVSALRMSAGLCVVGQPVRFDVQVRNFAAHEIRDVRLTLSIDNGEPVDETTLDVIGPSAVRNVTMFAKMRDPGTHTVTVSLPTDLLPTDDSRSVAVRAVSAVKVLLVDGDPGREPRESEVFFLRNALQPVPGSELENYFVKTTTIQSAELPNVRLDDFDAVFLCNVADLSAKSVADVTDYVRRGFGLVVFPGDRTLSSFWNDEFVRKVPLLPSPFGDARGNDKQQETSFTLKGSGLTHPIATLWADPESGNLSSAKFYKALTLTEAAQGPGSKAPAKTNAEPTSVILRFSDDTPAAMEKPFGRGRVIQFASTADTQWTDLPVRPGLFVPLMHRSLGSLVARQDESLTVNVGEPMSYRVGAELLGRDVVFTPPGGGDRSAGKIEMLDGSPMLKFENTSYGGAYTAAIGTGDEAAVVRFAAQPDTSESDLTDLPEPQIAALGQISTVVNYPDATLEQTLSKSRIGTELWLPLAILALLCAVTETFVADWFSRSR